MLDLVKRNARLFCGHNSAVGPLIGIFFFTKIILIFLLFKKGHSAVKVGTFLYIVKNENRNSMKMYKINVKEKVPKWIKLVKNNDFFF